MPSISSKITAAFASAALIAGVINVNPASAIEISFTNTAQTMLLLAQNPDGGSPDGGSPDGNPPKDANPNEGCSGVEACKAPEPEVGILAFGLVVIGGFVLKKRFKKNL